MPSGKAHDRITIATAALSVPLWYVASPVLDPTAYAAGIGAYLFSGFYLSGDLDTRCGALKRWGPLRVLWLPYQKFVPHRSWVSHGIAVGPLVRVAYFAFVIWAIARGLLWLIGQWIVPLDRNAVLENLAVWLASLVYHHSLWSEWALGGLILGGVAHTVADTVVSAVKRVW